MLYLKLITFLPEHKFCVLVSANVVALSATLLKNTRDNEELFHNLLGAFENVSKNCLSILKGAAIGAFTVPPLTVLHVGLGLDLNDS